MSDQPTSRSGGHELADLPFSWDRTTVPELPFGLPIGARLSVTSDSLRVHARHTSEGTVGELLGINTDVDQTVEFKKDEILSVDVFLMPDVPDDTDASWVRDEDLSWVVIRHRDPFGVEPWFESMFTSWKAYWPKALGKLLKERAGIEAVNVVQEDAESRKSRLEHKDHGARAEAIPSEGSSDNVIDLAEILRKRQMKEAQARLDNEPKETLGLLSYIEGLLHRERPLTEDEARSVAKFLVQTTQTGLFGYRARTWAASLLEEFDRTAANTLPPEYRQSVELSMTALKAFDSVACREVSVPDMNRFLLANQMQEDQKLTAIQQQVEYEEYLEGLDAEYRLSNPDRETK